MVILSFYDFVTVDQLNFSRFKNQIRKDKILGLEIMLFRFVPLSLHHCSLLVGSDIDLGVRERTYGYFAPPKKCEIFFKGTVEIATC